MRITFVLPGSAGGGVRANERFASGLMDRGHDVSLVLLHSYGGLRNGLRGAYLRLRYGSRQDWVRSFPGAVRVADRQLSRQVIGQNDVVIGVGVECVLAMANLPPECGIRIHECQGMEPWIMAEMLRAWELPFPRIVVASYLEREMRNRGVTDGILVVPNGFDPSDYFPSVPEEQRTGFGTVYHGTAPKDPAIMLATVAMVHERSPHTPIHVFGTFPRPRALPSAADYVRLPSLAKARDLYSRSLVWLCASRWEGFGLPLLEAMACGCAPVSTDCGGPADMIQDGVNGFLVRVGHVEDLASKILCLLHDGALRKEFVTASQIILQRLTWTESVARFESALKSIVDGN